jgi:hypothetical protein
MAPDLGPTRREDCTMSDSPRTAEEALQLWGKTLRALPKPERERLLLMLQPPNAGWLGRWLVKKEGFTEVIRGLEGVLNIMDNQLVPSWDKLQRHRNGPRELKKRKEDRHAFIDQYLETERTQGVAIGQEDWQKIHAAVKQENGEWLQGKKGIEMDPEDIKKQYRKARPEYNAACKRRSTRR